MLSKILRSSWWQKYLGGEGHSSPLHGDAIFKLLLREVEVGTLRASGGKWIFEYSDVFRKRSDLRPLVQFPDKAQIYSSEELWPFFGMRIPSLKQPSIAKIVDAEHIQSDDRVALLRRFGRRTISNPFQLVGK